MSKTKVMVFGSFDPLHKGHEYFFSQARKLGDTLICIVARDKTISALKKHKPDILEQERLKKVMPFVDEGALGDLEDHLLPVKKHKPDIICLGHDQVAFTDDLVDFIKDNNLKITLVRLGPYKRDQYKSSLIKAQKQSKIKKQNDSL